MQITEIPDEREILDPEFERQLSLIATYPDCARSRRQADCVFTAERKYFRQTNATQFKPSELSNAIDTQISQRAGKILACGLMAILFAYSKRQRTLNNASEIASVVLSAFPANERASWHDPFRGKWVHRMAPGDKNGVRDAFLGRSSVSHICAVNLFVSHHFKANEEPFESRSESEHLQVLRTIAEIEDRLSRHPRASKWNLWPLRKNLPESVLAMAPLEFPPNLRELIDVADAGGDAWAYVRASR